MSYILSPVRTVAICGNRHQSQYIPRIRNLITLLCRSGLDVYIDATFHKYITDQMPLESEVRIITPPFHNVEAVISIGGDGTFLHAAHKAGNTGIPIAGVNTGHLGFLANFSIDSPETLIETLQNGGATVESRDVLRIECPSRPAEISPYALNEISLLKEETSSMIDVNVEVDGSFLAHYLSDGLVISTPTGSTAYNLSVGGPILQPELSCMVLSPIAPHSLTIRPIVIGGNSCVTAVTQSRAANYRVSIDGNSFTAPCGEQITIHRADYKINVVRRPGETFASTLREKLLWGRR